MKGSVFPGDTMVFAGTVERRRRPTTPAAAGPTLLVHAHRRRRRSRPTAPSRVALPTADDDNPWTPPRRPVAPLTRTVDRRGLTDGSRLHRRAGDAARDGARRVQPVRVARDRARARGRPDRLPARALEAARRARPHRPDDPRGVRRLGHDAARRRRRLRGARPRARAVAALRQRGDERRACSLRAGTDEQKQAWLPAIAERRGDPHHRVARARARLRPARRAGHGRPPTATASCSTA